MTTNIFDRNVPKLASDSRWSAPIFDAEGREKSIAYIDDSGCDKIICVDDMAYIFAGNAKIIQEWKDWLLSDPETTNNMPETEDPNNNQLNIALCAVNMDTYLIELECRQVIRLPDARFTGSGGIAACDCWQENKDPCKAIQSAICKDRYSGGTVKFVNLLTRENNLQNTSTISETIKLMHERGLIMYSNKPSVSMPISDAAKNDPDVNHFMEKLANGSVNVCAPYPGMETPWSDEEKNQLKSSFEKILATKRTKRNLP
jgi:hypothetical protein